MIGLPDAEGGMKVEMLAKQRGIMCVSIGENEVPFGATPNGCAFKAFLNIFEDGTPLGFLDTPPGLTKQVDKSFSCPTEADLLINETFDIPMTIMSNQRLFSRDTFYARGIGPIKTILSTHDLQGEIKLKQENTFDLSVAQRPTDPDCLNRIDIGNVGANGQINDYPEPNAYGRMLLILNVDAFIDNAVVDVPLSFDLQKSIVQNIRKYNIREEL